MGDLRQSQIMGSLGDPAIPKSRGVWWTPKRYVGHIALDFNSRAHTGPSRTCPPFAPTMSARIFDRFLPYPIFFARRALCSAPRARQVHGPTNDIWHVAYAHWSSLLTHHVGEPNRSLTRSYAKVSVDNFAIFELVGTIPAITMPRFIEIFQTQVCVGPHWIPIGSHTER